MREIGQTSLFKRDLRRESLGQHQGWLAKRFVEIVHWIADNQLLPARFRDHALSNNWSGYRDCHLRPDLILIYRLPDENTLELVRLGSHAELSL